MYYNLTKFAIIIICVIIAAVCKDRDYALNKRDGRLLTVGLACTLAADFFLVLLFVYLPGLLFFCAAQILYAARFGGARVLRIIPAFVVIPATYFILGGDGVFALAIGYAQLFLLSYVCMIRALKRGVYPSPNKQLILIGMTLFVLCDISVALWNLGRMGVIDNERAARLANSAIWLFYAPSQVCLALSARKFVRDERRTHG